MIDCEARPRRRTGVDHSIALGERDGHRLLAQNCACAALRRPADEIGMRGSSGRNDHKVGPHLRDHLARVAEHGVRRKPELGGRLGACLLLHIGRGGDFETQIAQHLQVPQAHAAEAGEGRFHAAAFIAEALL